MSLERIRASDGVGFERRRQPAGSPLRAGTDGGRKIDFGRFVKKSPTIENIELTVGGE